MDLERKHVAVLGAAGKMGSGIALLLLQKMCGAKEGTLTLLDVNFKRFDSLKRYLREHLIRYAERNINQLRKIYQNDPSLVDNEEMIRTFVENGIDRTRFVTSVEECKGAEIIFEAIVEEMEAKVELLSNVDVVADNEAVYFSNTSSIPIHVLEERSGLKGRLIGFHFYNPPVVQKLLEIIIPEGANKEAVDNAMEMGRLLNKTIVFSADIAGFIGNGHFIREVSEACHQVDLLSEEMEVQEAISTVNQVTQDFLIRPMGIFQLVDYVGIDVVQHIMKIMTEYLVEEKFNTTLIDAMVLREIKGGQNADGSQKEGFFNYDKGKPALVYNLKSGRYVTPFVPEEYCEFPKEHISWKVLSQDNNKEEKLADYFASLFESQTKGSKLAIYLLEHSRSIAEKLVQDGVARSIEDVDTVLKNGFFHLYGIETPWVIK